MDVDALLSDLSARLHEIETARPSLNASVDGLNLMLMHSESGQLQIFAEEVRKYRLMLEEDLRQSPLPRKMESLDSFYKNAGLYLDFTFHPARDVKPTSAIDLPCVDCESDSIFAEAFTATTREVGTSLIHIVELSCSRDRSHRVAFVVMRRGVRIRKVGQTPSSRDMESVQFRRFRNRHPDLYKELVSAIGLASHGVGIGAFVYYRRVIETLVREAEKARGDTGGGEPSRVVERIKSLRGFLPDFLVENASVYQILSKGVHELNDDECKDHEPLVRLAILQILEEEAERRARQQRENELRERLSTASSALRKPT